MTRRENSGERMIVKGAQDAETRRLPASRGMRAPTTGTIVPRGIEGKPDDAMPAHPRKQTKYGITGGCS